MKVTQNTLISDIRNLATSGSNSNDFRIEDAQIAYWIDQVRSDLIAKDIQARKDLSSIWIQPITCLALVAVDKSECCEVETNCKILRTELTIPRTIETNQSNTIVRVTDNSGNIISRTTENSSKYDSHSKYTSTKPKWFLKNDYIYIINNEFLSHINVDGIWESPSELSAYTSCDGNTCFDSDAGYPCSSRMSSAITDIVLKTKVLPFLQIPQDTTNDAANTQPTRE